MGTEWDAGTYDRIADPMHRWGQSVLERFPVERGVVLDAGCGSGRVTQDLLDRSPGVRVIALDASAAMLDEARTRLAPFGDRVRFVRADLGVPLPVEQVDGVLSTATFHWVRDHDALFANLAAVMRPGAPLAAQCGGGANVQRVWAAARAAGSHAENTPYFAGVVETEARLAASGFTDIEVWLEEAPVRFDSTDELATYLASVVLREHVEGMAPPQRDAFLARTIETMGEPVIDYVRLNIAARRRRS